MGSQSGPKTVPNWVQIGSKKAPNGAKTAPSWPRKRPGWPKIAPRWPKLAPRGSQEGPRGPQSGPRWPKRAPREPQEGPRRPQEGPKRAQEGPKMAPRGPKIPPRWPQEGFNMVIRKLENGDLADGPCIFSQIALSSAFPLHVSSFLSFRGPEIAQNDSKMARDGLKMAPRWPPDGPQTPRTSAYLGVPRRTWGQFWVLDGPKKA